MTTLSSSVQEPNSDTRVSTLTLWSVIGLVATFGVVVRVRQFLFGRSLWHDEAALARNMGRSFIELLEPLGIAQAAPVGFLWITKAATLLGQPSKFYLRLFPLLAGVLALLLMPVVAKRFLTPLGVFVATCLLVFSDRHIYYSNEFKQYSGDVLVALLLTWGAVYLVDKRLTFTHALIFGVLGGLTVWLSHAAIFGLAAAGLVLLVVKVKGRFSAEIPPLLLAATLWLASFITNYLFILRRSTDNTTLQDYWQGAFPPSPLNPVALLEWLNTQFWALFNMPGSFQYAGLGAGLFMIGCVALWQTKRAQLALLVLPLLFVLLAAALRQYPFADRLLLFWQPALYMVVAAGLAALNAALHKTPLRFAPWLLLFVMLFGSVQLAIDGVRWVSPEQEIEAVLAPVVERISAEDTVYVYYGAKHAFAYYQPWYSFDAQDVILGNAARDNWPAYYAELDTLAQKGDVYLIFSHIHGGSGAAEDRLFTNYLDLSGAQLVEAWHAHGAAAYLYDTTEMIPLHTDEG